MIPVKKNLKKWLQPFRQDSGAVCEFSNINKQLAKAAKNAGLKWKKNALRHSYISYRKAECADIARVADEAGNSVEVIKGNYLKVIKPVEAARWFAIAPTRPANLIKLSRATRRMNKKSGKALTVENTTKRLLNTTATVAG